MALITLAEAKIHLNIPAATLTHDAELTGLLATASALVEGYADRTWTATTVTETSNGGGSKILLRQSPVASVTSVSVAGVALAATAYEVDLAAGIIALRTPSAAGQANVTVVYAVGGTVPDLAKQATKEAVRHLWQTQRGSMGGRNPLGGDDYSGGMAFSLPRRVQELLDPIRVVN